jgi:glycosyltransferase involved in cell wall biosynthesis
MKVGFSLDYNKNDATQMCLHVAQVALDLGCDVEFFPRERPVQVHPFWDRFVLREKRGRFDEWLTSGGLDQLIYTHIPADRELKQVKDNHIDTYLLVLWELIEERALDNIAMFDYVICPGKASLKLLTHRTALPNLCIIPWDTGVPITFEPRRISSDRIGVIWPLEWQQVKRQEPKFVNVATQLLELLDNVWLTITYSNNITSELLRELRRMVTFGDGRVELLKSLSLDKQELLFGHHDLTLWPSLTESVAIVGLTSLCMGTPVIAFDHPTAADAIKDGRNGILVQCEIENHGIGGAKVKPDYPSFGRRLTEMVRDVEALDHLRQNTINGLRERREVFTSKWKDLLVGNS